MRVKLIFDGFDELGNPVETAYCPVHGDLDLTVDDVVAAHVMRTRDAVVWSARVAAAKLAHPELFDGSVFDIHCSCIPVDFGLEVFNVGRVLGLSVRR